MLRDEVIKNSTKVLKIPQISQLCCVIDYRKILDVFLDIWKEVLKVSKKSCSSFNEQNGCNDIKLYIILSNNMFIQEIAY